MLRLRDRLQTSFKFLQGIWKTIRSINLILFRTDETGILEDEMGRP
jgi:hypothetical protein